MAFIKFTNADAIAHHRRAYRIEQPAAIVSSHGANTHIKFNQSAAKLILDGLDYVELQYDPDTEKVCLRCIPSMSFCSYKARRKNGDVLITVTLFLRRFNINWCTGQMFKVEYGGSNRYLILTPIHSATE